MERQVVITGSASGIGAATANLFRSMGDRVIGVDLRDAEIEVDLSRTEGRTRLIAEAKRLAPDGLDAVIAVAGVSSMTKDPRIVVSVNYFAAVHTLTGLRPLLSRARRPRAVAVSSTASLSDCDPALVSACLRGDEAGAAARSQVVGAKTYHASKKALSLWLRRVATSPEWAGAGIMLNAVAPGAVHTPMTAPILASDEGAALLWASTPVAVANYARPEDLAEAIAFLATLEGRYLLGQILYVDGGTDALLRPDVL